MYMHDDLTPWRHIMTSLDFLIIILALQIYEWMFFSL